MQCKVDISRHILSIYGSELRHFNSCGLRSIVMENKYETGYRDQRYMLMLIAATQLYLQYIL